MPSYPSFDISVDLGQSAWVKGGDNPTQAAQGQVRVDINMPKANEIVAEVLYKLADAVLAGKFSIPLKINTNSKIIRDTSYKIPPC